MYSHSVVIKIIMYTIITTPITMIIIMISY